MQTEVAIEGFDGFIKDAEQAGLMVEPLVTGALANSTGRIQSTARSLARHRTGTLQRSIMTEVRYPVGEVTVGEKYGIIHEEGSGIYGPSGQPITPKTAKVLAFKAGGSMVFTKKVKGVKPKPFFGPAISGAAGYIDRQFTRVTERLVERLAGL